MSTGSVTESPTSWATLSISMTSPTATFCCWPPLRTIAYTADSLSSSDYKFGSACRARAHHTEGWGRRTWTHDGASAPRIKSTDGLPTGQNEPSANHLPLPRPFLLDRYVRPRLLVRRRIDARLGAVEPLAVLRHRRVARLRRPIGAGRGRLRYGQRSRGWTRGTSRHAPTRGRHHAWRRRCRSDLGLRRRWGGRWRLRCLRGDAVGGRLVGLLGRLVGRLLVGLRLLDRRLLDGALL